jgi:hypothetical protein
MYFFSKVDETYTILPRGLPRRRRPTGTLAFESSTRLVTPRVRVQAPCFIDAKLL